MHVLFNLGAKAGFQPPSIVIVRKFCKLLKARVSIHAGSLPAFNIKLWPNDCNISTQLIPTLLAQHLQSPAKRSQNLNATDRNIVGRNMLHAFCHLVATCYDMLRVENRTNAYAQAQHCCTNLAKRLQHHVTSTNAA